MRQLLFWCFVVVSSAMKYYYFKSVIIFFLKRQFKSVCHDKTTHTKRKSEYNTIQPAIQHYESLHCASYCARRLQLDWCICWKPTWFYPFFLVYFGNTGIVLNLLGLRLRKIIILKSHWGGIQKRFPPTELLRATQKRWCETLDHPERLTSRETKCGVCDVDQAIRNVTFPQ